MTSGNAKLRILRQDPERGERPHYTIYTVSLRGKMSLLQALEEIHLHHDPSLTFAYSCGIGKCGSCTVLLDGKPVLACRQILDGRKELTVEPIRHFPVLKDLLVDRSPADQRVRGFLGRIAHADESQEKVEGFLSEHLIPYKKLTECTGCLACDSSCPVLKVAPDLYFGPSTTAMITGPGPRILSSREETRGVPVKSSIDYCTFCLNCDDACPSDVPFHRLNAVAKQAYSTKKGWDLHDQIVGRLGTFGKLMSRVPRAAGRIQRANIAKVLMDSLLDFDRRIEFPPFKSDAWMRDHETAHREDETRVAFFVGCFARYFDPDSGRAMIEILTRNRVSVLIPDQQCCGMPLLSKGRLGEASRIAEGNLRTLSWLVEKGYDIVASCTSCSWMLKKGYPETLQLQGAEDVAAKTHDLGEYLLRLRDSGSFDTNLKPVDLSVAYHTPCHLRSQKIGRPFLEILRLIPGLELTDATKLCCGLSGTYGLRKHKYDIAISVGRELFDAITASGAERVVSECGMCRTQIAHGTGLSTSHPINILHAAYFEMVGQRLGEKTN